jgi:hypothetical protein
VLGVKIQNKDSRPLFSSRHLAHPMSPMLRLGVLLIMVPCAISCSSAAICKERTLPDTRPATELTAASAKAALLEFIQAMPAEDPARKTLRAVKENEPRQLDEQRVAIGPWECMLTQRRFSFLIARTQPPTIFFLEEGEFVQTTSGVWKAVRTRTIRVGKGVGSLFSFFLL